MSMFGGCTPTRVVAASIWSSLETEEVDGNRVRVGWGNVEGSWGVFEEGGGGRDVEEVL
jgi:hypothetical protein